MIYGSFANVTVGRTLVKCIKKKSLVCYNCMCSVLVAQSCPTLCSLMDCSPPCSSASEIFPGKNTAVGYNFLLQGTFPTQGSDPGLSHIVGRSCTVLATACESTIISLKLPVKRKFHSLHSATDLSIV